MNRKSLLSAFCLLGGTALIAIGWWDYWNPNVINQWWLGEQIYPFYWRQLALTLAILLPLALLAWGLGVAARTRSEDTSSAGRRRGAACGFAAALAIPLILVLKYQVTWLGINYGSSVWAYGFILVLSVLITWLIWPVLRNQRLLAWLDRQGPMIILIAILIYVVVYGGLSIARQASFRTQALGLGTIDQAIWNTSRGRLLEYTPLLVTFDDETQDMSPRSRLADGRLELILLPLSAFYWVWAEPRWLMALQVILLAGGAIPLYHLARAQLGDGTASLVITLAYLVYLPLHLVTIAGFHPSALMIPFLLWAWLAAERGRWRNYYIAIIVALLCGIDAALALLGIGLYFLFRGRPYRLHGALTLLLGLAWLTLDMVLVVPWARRVYGPEGYGGMEGDVSGIAPWLLTHPLDALGTLLDREKLQALVDLLAAVGWIPILAPLRLLLALPVLVYNLLTSSPYQDVIRAHDLAPAIPFVFIALVGGTINAGRLVARFSEEKEEAPGLPRAEGVRLATLFALTTAFLVGLFFSPLPPGWGFRPADYYQVGEHEQALARTLELIPADAVVSAQSGLFPHLSRRPVVYLFPTVADAEYVVLDLDYRADKAPLDDDLFFSTLDGLLADPDFHVVTFDSGALLLKRGPGQAPPGFAETLADYRAGLYRSAVSDYRGPTRLQTNNMYEAEVVLENRGTQSWQTAGPYPIYLNHHWWAADGSPVEWYGLPTPLKRVVRPGDILAQQVRFVTPSEPGDYVLEWDLVQERQTWFGDRGSITLRVDVQSSK